MYVWFWIFENLFENFCDVCERGRLRNSPYYNTAQKMKFSIKGFFSKCDQIRRKLRSGHIYWRNPNAKLHFLCSVSGRTDYEFSELILLSYKCFDGKCLLLSLNACVYRQTREWLRLLAHVFHSWQISWFLTARWQNYLRKLSLRLDISPICFWLLFFFWY